MAKYKTGDIVLLTELCGGKTVIITEIDDSKPLFKYAARQIGGRSVKTYWTKESQIADKIGEKADHPYVLERQRGVANSPKNVVGGREKVMAYLRTRSPGDIIQTTRKGVDARLSFNRMIPNGRRFVFSATNANGTSYRYPWEFVVLPATNE